MELVESWGRLWLEGLVRFSRILWNLRLEVARAGWVAAAMLLVSDRVVVEVVGRLVEGGVGVERMLVWGAEGWVWGVGEVSVIDGSAIICAGCGESV